MLKPKYFLLLILFLAALGFRLYPGSSAVIFPYDQARDVLIAKHIVENRDLPLLGPVSDIPGVHHGAIYYWLITPLYALNHYDPSLIVLLFSILSAAGVFSYFFVVRRLYTEKMGWIAAVIYAFSFATVSYARWISNPPLVIPMMPILVLLLYELITRNRHAFWLGVLLGLFVQLELVLGYLVFAVGFWVIRTKKIKQMLMLIAGFFVGALPLFVSEFKFGFQGLRGLLGFASKQASAQVAKSSPALIDVVDKFSLLSRDTVFGLTAPLAFLLILGVIIAVFCWRREVTKYRLSLSLIFSLWLSSLLLFCVGKQATNFFLVGQEFILICLVALFLSLRIFKRKLVLMGVLLVLVGLQLRLFVAQTQAHQAYVQVQQGVLLGEREQVVDAIYAKTAGQPFTISVFGTPYGVRTAWAYYLWLYQSQHHSNLPRWYGFAADGYYGDELLPKVDAPANIHITVYEPYFSVDQVAMQVFTEYQDAHTNVTEEFELNHHRIQIRHPR